MKLRHRSSAALNAGSVALLALLQLAPAVALAALASFDLDGRARAVPTTMGALEAAPPGLAAPRGLTVTVQRASA